MLLSAHAGHWTGAGTGVTVIVPPPGTVGSGEVRGGAPATREFALLEPGRLVDRVDAVVLSGGSALGLAAADGVARELWQQGRGFETTFGAVPIVIGMSIYDASVGGTPPDAEAGRLALRAAFTDDGFATGAVGAGAGASTGKWRSRRDPGGIGMAREAVGPAALVAVAVVNAWGDVLGEDGRPLFAPDANPGGGEVASRGQHPAQPDPFPRLAQPETRPRSAQPETRPRSAQPEARPPDFSGYAGFLAASRPSLGNTTVAVLLTDARLSKGECHLLAQSGHTGLARALHPAHSRYDGDAVVALATGEIDGADLDLLRAAAAEVMAAAIRNAVIQ